MIAVEGVVEFGVVEFGVVVAILAIFEFPQL
jgi:hypothetical protein